ncbi:flavodoxin family protein [Streptomyces sp. NPDC002659]|uniref:flavodoxin family protein n=1 Tax=Streptomyces sp. NPDC002659 TaxID=3364656 RepID=UPI0036D05962
MQPRIAIAYHSGYGHTAAVAQAVAQGATQAGGQVSLLAVEELSEDDWAALAQADAIVFGTPTYMGGPAAAFKAFADASSKVWADDLGWQDKLAAGFTNSGSMSGDKLATLTYLATFAAQHGMQWISLGLMPGWNTSTGSPHDLNRLGSYLGLMTQANTDEPADHAPPTSDIATAEHLGRRVTTLTARWIVAKTTARTPVST